MFGRHGKKRVISLVDASRPDATPLDHLGYCIPPGSLTLDRIERALIVSLDRQRFSAGHGVPSMPTRYIVRMNPADRAWLPPASEELLARALESYADRTGSLVVGSVRIGFRPDPLVHPGRPQVWAGFTEDDLLVLSSPRAAAEIFADR